MTDKKLALYGALYLDRGERMPKAVEQIDALKGQVTSGAIRPGGFFFDVLFAKDQQEMAERYTKEIEDAVHAAFADVEATQDMYVVIVALPATSKTGDPRDHPHSARSIAMGAMGV